MVDAVVQTCQLGKKKKKARYARASIDSGARGADSAAIATDVGSVVESVVGCELEGGSAGICADVGSGADADAGAGVGLASAFFSYIPVRRREGEDEGASSAPPPRSSECSSQLRARASSAEHPQ
jgi:hypothetical protein